MDAHTFTTIYPLSYIHPPFLYLFVDNTLPTMKFLTASCWHLCVPCVHMLASFISNHRCGINVPGRVLCHIRGNIWWACVSGHECTTLMQVSISTFEPGPWRMSFHRLDNLFEGLLQTFSKFLRHL